MLLLPFLLPGDRSRIPDPQLVLATCQQALKPIHVSARLHPDYHRPLQSRVESSCLFGYAAAGVRPSRPFLCPTLRSVGNSDESHSLYTSYAASFVSSSSVISKSSLLETVGAVVRHPIKRSA